MQMTPFKIFFPPFLIFQDKQMKKKKCKGPRISEVGPWSVPMSRFRRAIDAQNFWIVFGPKVPQSTCIKKLKSRTTNPYLESRLLSSPKILHGLPRINSITLFLPQHWQGIKQKIPTVFNHSKMWVPPNLQQVFIFIFLRRKKRVHVFVCNHRPILQNTG